MSQVLPLFLFILLSIQLSAQDPSFLSFTVEDGLVSNHVSGIAQDKDGFMWFSTDQGLMRFDGEEMDQFGLKDSLPDQDIRGLVLDDQQRIWLKSANGRPAYIQSGRVVTGIETLPLQQINLESAITKIHVSEDSYYFGSESNGFALLKNGELAYERKGEGIQNIYEDNQGQLYVVSGNLEEQLFQISKNRILLRTGDRLVLRAQDSTTVLMPQKSKVFRQEITDVFEDSRGGLWLVKKGGGIFCYPKFDQGAFHRIRHWFHGKLITSIFEDREGSLWFGTRSQGVLLVVNPEARSYGLDDGLSSDDIQSVYRDADARIWLGNSQGQVQSIDPEGPIKTDDISYDLNTYLSIDQIDGDEQGNLWYGSDQMLLVKDRDAQLSFLNLDGANDLEITEDQHALLANDLGLMRFDLTKDNRVDTLYRGITVAVSALNSEEVWMATDKGIYLARNGGLQSFNIEGGLLQQPITDLAIGPKAKVFLLQGKGALVISGAKQILLTEANGLISNNCHKVVTCNSGVYFLLSSNGISKLYVDNQEIRMSSITKLDGIASNQVNDIHCFGDTIYVATNRGMSVLPMGDRGRAEVPPSLLVKRINISDRDTSVLSSYQLSYDQNNIQVFFSALAFSSLAELQYRYKLEGVDEDWYSSNSSQVRYTNLSPGKHTLLTQVINRNGKMSETNRLTFHVAPPFWKTWWFRAASALLGLLILAAAVYLLFRYQKEKSELNQKIREGQLMALRAQMNPHFIFNCLNSIQYFVMENDKRSANLYLSMFSDLMRRVLENSRHASIPIEDEVESLQLYLQLESLRFSHQFSYDILVDPDIDQEEEMIPPMLIQPFAENAIWHGLLPKDSAGSLSIRLMRNNDLLRCIIEDNGIGRDKAQEIAGRKRHGHKSAGMKNTAKRLNMLQQKSGNENRIQGLKVVDLYEQDQASGTRVEIMIPLQ